MHISLNTLSCKMHRQLLSFTAKAEVFELKAIYKDFHKLSGQVDQRVLDICIRNLATF